MSFHFPCVLYAIADPCGRADLNPVEITRQLLDGGARIVQLRWKPAATAALVAAAREIRALTRQRNALFIVNDRVDVAMAVDADGVHLGQQDLPLDAARRLLGPGFVIGLSTHDVGQAREAEQRGADYLGFGPIFETTTKATGYTPRGLAELRDVRRAVRLPIVAIGGIRERNAHDVLAAGADVVAIISELVLAADSTAKTKNVLAKLRSLARP